MAKKLFLCREEQSKQCSHQTGERSSYHNYSLSFEPHSLMESLSIGLSISLPQLNHPRTRNSLSNSVFAFANFSPQAHKSSSSSCSKEIHHLEIPNAQSTLSLSTHFCSLFLKTHLSFWSMGLLFPLSSFASETAVASSSEEVSTKVDLEAILVSIDEFFNKNPFFVAGVVFIWLVVVPFLEEYFRKYKFISAIDAFRKLRDDPNCQLLDIRDKRSLKALNSPNLKILNKNVLQVEFREGDEDGFLKQVLDKFEQPENTIICIIDK